jgi:hypothetical protein
VRRLLDEWRGRSARAERWGVPAALDQLLFAADWSHERWEDNEQKYLGRQGEYPGYDRGLRGEDPQLPHLPDYPWPTHSVVLNGRGQFPCEGRWVTEADCRIIREHGWVRSFPQHAHHIRPYSSATATQPPYGFRV